MARLNLVPTILGLVFFLCATGCNHGVDLSPDGKTIVETNGQGVTIRDVNGKRPDLTLKFDASDSPKFSPDGKSIAIEHQTGTILIHSDGSRMFKVPAVKGPYAWRPDGSELLGFDQSEAKVIHLRSKSIVRKYNLSMQSTMAACLGNSRDFVAADSHKLIVIHEGKILSRQATGTVNLVAFDEQRRRILWCELFDFPNMKPFQPTMVEIHASDLKLQNVETILERTSAQDVLCEKNRYVMPVSVAISPDGQQLATTGIVCVSKPGVIERYEALGGFNQTKTTPAVERKLKALEKQINLQSVCTVIPLAGPRRIATQRFARVGTDAYIFPFWSGDSRDVRVVMDHKVYATTKVQFK